MVEAKLKWTGGIKFEGTSAFRLPITIDGAEEAGGSESGYKPTELVLFGLAGCTGMDVVKILEKQRQELTGLEIEVAGYQPEQYPKPYNKIDIKFILTGKNLNPEKVEHAIALSEGKYCMVSQSLAGVAKITTGFEIKEG